ncbi:hypothetical protein K0M31_014188, partial [Melipona bicolor]
LLNFAEVTVEICNSERLSNSGFPNLASTFVKELRLLELLNLELFSSMNTFKEQSNKFLSKCKRESEPMKSQDFPKNSRRYSSDNSLRSLVLQ